MGRSPERVRRDVGAGDEQDDAPPREWPRLEEGGKTKVAVSVTGQPAGVAQPMHIHKGTCDKLDPKPTYGLPSLINGKSEATVDVSLADLQKGGYAINGHKSAQEVSTYVYCGAIPAM